MNVEQTIIEWIKSCETTHVPKLVGLTLGALIANAPDFGVLVDVRSAPRIASDGGSSQLHRVEVWISVYTDAEHLRTTVWNDIATHIWELFDCCKSSVRFAYPDDAIRLVNGERRRYADASTFERESYFEPLHSQQNLDNLWRAFIIGVEPMGIIRSNMNDRSDRNMPAMRMFNVEMTVQVGD